MAYIYKITNDINQKIYIGKTEYSIEKRFQEHCHDAFKRQLESRPLYAAIRKYGVEHFHVEMLEECSIQQLNEREIYWIELLGSFKYGYNATKGGDGRAYVDSELIYSLWCDGYNITQIHYITNYDTHTISTYLNDYGISLQERRNRGYQKQAKIIAQLDKQTEKIIRVYSSINEAYTALNITPKNSHISEVCNGKRKTAYGYKWKYLN